MKEKFKTGLIIIGTTALISTAWVLNVKSEAKDYTPPESTTTTSETYESRHGTNNCTSDCSGHNAGYEWADKHDICDPGYDNGNSESFNEGVIAWAYDNCYYGDENGPF